MRDDPDLPQQSAIAEFLEAWTEQHSFEPEPYRPHQRRAAVYARRSISDAEDVSIGAQVDAAAAHCEAIGAAFDPRHLLFIDRHRSGKSMDGREGLAALLAAAEGGAFEVLVLREIDRLTRSVADGAELVVRFTDLGIEVHRAGRGPVDPGEMVMLALYAQWDRARISEECRTARRRAAAAGSLIGSWQTYGYDRVEGERGWTINPFEAAVIRRCFEQLHAGSSQSALAKTLNSEEIPGPRGGLWRSGSFYKPNGYGILQRPLLKGIFTYARVAGSNISVPVPHLAIVGPELFDQTEALWRSKSVDTPSKEGSVRSRPHRASAGGTVRCACGAPMRRRGTGKATECSLVCQDASLGKACGRTTTMPLGEIDRRVLQIVRDELLEPERSSDWQRIRALNWEERERELAARRARIDCELGQIDLELAQSDDEGPDSQSPLALARRGRLELRQHKLFQERTGLDLPPLRDAMPESEVQELRAAVSSLMERLPLRTLSDDEKAITEKIRELIPQIELETSDCRGSYRLRFLLGMPGCPEARTGRQPWPEGRTFERIFPWPVAGRLRYPEALLAQHRLADEGVFRLAEADWKAVRGLFKPYFGSGRDARMVAEALIFIKATRLSGAMLPERYFEVADRLAKTGGIWPKMADILRKRRSPLVLSLETAQAPVAANPLAGQV